MTANSRGITRLTETFTASAERVFDAWLSPEKMARWFLPDTGGQVARVEIDARVGGSIRVVTHRAGRAVEHTGEYLEIQRPHRLSFTIGSSASARAVRVTVLIEPRGAGCSLTLISAIEPAPLRALASLGALETYRAETVARPRWPMRLECKAALSLGLHLAMLPLLPIVLRGPVLPSGAGPLPTPAMLAVSISTAEGVKLPQPSFALAVVVPGAAPAMAPPPPSAPAPPVTVRQSPAVARRAPHATTSRNTPPFLRPRTTPQANRTATSQGASASWLALQAFNASGAPAHSASGPDHAAGAQVEPPLAGTTCTGTISFSSDGGFFRAQGATYLTFYGGQKVLAEARFFRDRDGSPWIRFTLSAGAPWNFPVTIAGSEIRWTDVNGSGYALRPVGNNHLTGLVGFYGDSAAKIDFTCTPSDAHST